MNRCTGCGALLQTENKEKLGYIPKEKYENSKLCERCFRILHYNDLKIIDLPKTKEILKIVNASNSFAFFLVDLLNINKEVLDTYKNITIPKCLIVCKIDFIPKYIKKEKIKNWLQEEYKVLDDIIFLSAKKNVNMHGVLSILQVKNIKTAYLMGYTNVGKSTLINRFQENSLITTSLVPNTTVDFIKIQLEDGVCLIDTPGFQYQKTVYLKDDITFIKKVNPKWAIKPVTFQLKKGASIVIEKDIRIENKTESCNLTFYMSNLLSLKKVYEKNEALKNLNKVDIHVKRNEDIVIKGLGFINVKSDSFLLIYIKDPELIEIRNSFFER